MGLLKAVFVGFLAALLIATFAGSFPDSLESMARWASFDFSLGEYVVSFSIPVFAAVTLFSWLLIFGMRD